MRALFGKLYFRRLGKHSETETGFKTNFPSDEGKEFHHFLLRCFDIQISKNMTASQRNISFGNIGYMLFMDYDNEHKINDLDDGWVLDSE